MKLLSEVYLEPRNNLIHFRDDPDYDPDPGSGLLWLLPMNEVYQKTDFSNCISDQVGQYEAHIIHQNTTTIASCKCETHSEV